MSSKAGKTSENMRATNEERIRSYSRKKKLDSLVRTAPLPKNKNYKNVEPRLLTETQKEEIINKRGILEEKKIQKELEGCTFKPQLNQNSLAMTRNNPKPPIVERGVPERYQRTLVEELEKNLKTQRLEQEAQTLKLPDNTGKAPNKEFYDEKVAWKKEALKKVDQKRKEQDDAVVSTFVGKPELNDYSKNKIVPADKLDSDEFLKRVEKTIEKKKQKIEGLTNKFYDFPYKPALYKPRRAGETN